MKISQSEHGGNGVSARVVNQWLPRATGDLRPKPGHLPGLGLCRAQALLP
jgi:hypothetical protein